MQLKGFYLKAGIARKLNLVLLVMIIGFILIMSTLIITISLSRIGGGNYQKIKQNRDISEKIESLRADLNDIRLDIMSLSSEEEAVKIEKLEKDIETKIKEADRDFGEIAAAAKDEDALSSISSAKTTWEEYKKTYNNEFQDYIKTGEFAKAHKIAMGIQKRRQERFSEQIESAVNSSILKTHHYEAYVDDLVSKLILVFGAAALFIFIVLVFITRGISHSIIGSLKKLSASTSEIIDSKDLSKRVFIDSRDEVSHVGETFNKFMISINAIIQKIHHVSTEIKNSSATIISSLEEQKTGATEQASSISKMVDSLGVLANSAEEIADGAEKVTASAETTSLKVNEITKKIEDAKLKIMGFEEKSETIQEITGMIDALSERTDILALNAAIEAARAGKQGEGFSVVAEEIKQLSASSVKSTEKIRQIVTEIQEEIKTAVEAITSSTKETEEGLRMVSDTSALTKKIYLSTEQQKDSSKQAAENATGINEIASRFLGLTTNIHTEIEDLNKLSEELEDIVSSFKTNMPEESSLSISKKVLV